MKQNTFVNFLIGTAKTVTITIIIVAGPALLASLLYFDSSIYTNCMESPAYTVLTAFCALIGCIGYFLYEDEHKTISR